MKLYKVSQLDLSNKCFHIKIAISKRTEIVIFFFKKKSIKFHTVFLFWDKYSVIFWIKYTNTSVCVVGCWYSLDWLKVGERTITLGCTPFILGWIGIVLIPVCLYSIRIQWSQSRSLLDHVTREIPGVQGTCQAAIPSHRGKSCGASGWGSLTFGGPFGGKGRPMQYSPGPPTATTWNSLI